MMLSTIQINNLVKIAYSDTGAPESQTYLTIFAIHGIAFSNYVFKRLESSARAAGVRLVSLSRRGYHSTSPYTPSEHHLIRGGCKDTRATLFNEQCHDLGLFISKFIYQHKLPPVSADGKHGGVAILGWSMGSVFACGILTALPSQPAEFRELFTAHVRGLILFDVAAITLGKPLLPKEWMPLFDPSITEAEGLSMFVSWVTSYFDHNSRMDQDPEGLSYVPPSTTRTPSIYRMDRREQELIVDQDAGTLDVRLGIGLETHFNETYKTACFHPSIRDTIAPHMRVLHIFGGSSGAFAYSGRWTIEADNNANGGGFIEFHTIHEGNHFMHWDHPAEVMSAINNTFAFPGPKL